MGLLIRLDRASKTPLFRQILEGLVDLIEAGTLKPGERLPATRALAGSLAVNRSTVYRAYQELWSQGYLESRPGSYSTVRKRPRSVGPRPVPKPGLIDWSAASNPAARGLIPTHRAEEELLRRAAEPGLINFIPLSPDPRLFPLDEFRKGFNQVLHDRGRELLQYGDPLGYEPLRGFIADRMRLHGMAVGPEEIMITHGAQAGLGLVLGLLAEPGARVLVEEPTYSRAIDLLHLHRAEPEGLAMGPQGPDLDRLADLLAAERTALVYTIPNFHNPTGSSADQPHRERLLRLCEKYRVPLVEDGFEEEMKYFRKAIPPIKSMDRGRVVIYLGTFSKVLLPGLRIGWIAADREGIERLVPIHKAALIAGNVADQAALHEFCKSGRYDLHIRRLQRIYRSRMETALAALDQNLGSLPVTWTRPGGGYTLWLGLPGRPGHEPRLIDLLLNHGVAVLPGSFHYHRPPPGIFFRVSIAHLDEEAIGKGVERLRIGVENWLKMHQ